MSGRGRRDPHHRRISTGIRFAGLLLVGATLYFGGRYAEDRLSDRQDGWAVLVNESGRQRMRTQRVALLAHRIWKAKPAQRPRLRNRLEELIRTTHETHESLETGNSQLYPSTDASRRIRRHYFREAVQLDRRLHGYLEEARRLLDTSAPDSVLRRAVGRLDRRQRTILRDLDRVVEAYEEAARESSGVVRRQSFAMIGALVLLFLAAGAFWIQPLVEQLRRRAAERAASLFDAAPDALLLIDGDGRIREGNDRAAELFGLPRAELRGMSAERVLALENAELSDLAERLESGASGRPRLPDRLPGEGRSTTGDAFPVECRLQAVDDHGRTRLMIGVRDLSPRQEAEQARARAELRYQSLLEHNVAGAFRASEKGTILDCNQTLSDALGADSPDELVGLSTTELHAEEGAGRELLAALGADGVVRGRELALLDHRGRTVWFLVNAALIDDPELEGRSIIGTAVDITRRKRLEARLESMAYRDPLTDLPNRRALRERLDQMLRLCSREGRRIAVAMADLRQFKDLNDRFGHEAGDSVLRAVGKRLRIPVRDADTVARLGGDEFVLALADVDDKMEARTAVARVREEVQKPVELDDGRRVQVDVDFGVAVHPGHGSTMDELLVAADRAMYRAKRNGQGVALFDPEHDREAERVSVGRSAG